MYTWITSFKIAYHKQNSKEKKNRNMLGPLNSTDIDNVLRARAFEFTYEIDFQEPNRCFWFIGNYYHSPSMTTFITHISVQRCDKSSVSNNFIIILLLKNFLKLIFYSCFFIRFVPRNQIPKMIKVFVVLHEYTYWKLKKKKKWYVYWLSYAINLL